MEILIPKQIKENPQMILRRLGYHPSSSAYTKGISYIRRLGPYFYPRFHIYLTKDKKGNVVLNLHLDQKRPSYPQGHAHSAEYDSPPVIQEAERIKNFINNLK
jgi:hypothetical protein